MTLLSGIGISVAIIFLGRVFIGVEMDPAWMGFSHYGFLPRFATLPEIGLLQSMRLIL
jgi:hypothetical protein